MLARCSSMMWKDERENQGPSRDLQRSAQRFVRVWSVFLPATLEVEPAGSVHQGRWLGFFVSCWSLWVILFLANTQHARDMDVGFVG